MDYGRILVCVAFTWLVTLFRVFCHLPVAVPVISRSSTLFGAFATFGWCCAENYSSPGFHYAFCCLPRCLLVLVDYALPDSSLCGWTLRYTFLDSCSAYRYGFCADWRHRDDYRLPLRGAYLPVVPPPPFGSSCILNVATFCTVRCHCRYLLPLPDSTSS